LEVKPEVTTDGSPLRAILACTLAVAAAVLHVAVASDWAGAEEHLGAVVMGWGGALALGSATFRRERACSGTFRIVAACLGYVLAFALAVRNAGAYAPLYRALPLASGTAVVLALGGARPLAVHGRELALLALPLLHPLPGLVRNAIMPLRETAVAAGLVLRAIGFPAEVTGTHIAVPHAVVEVMDACSGLGAISQLLALAVLLLSLFETTRLQKVLVVTSAVAVGFTVNAARVAFLAVVASRTPDEYAYYERYGKGSLAFPVIAAVVAASIWWGVLGLRRTPPPQAVSSTA
jgi:cyanoexosortase A